MGDDMVSGNFIVVDRCSCMIGYSKSLEMIMWKEANTFIPWI